MEEEPGIVQPTRLFWGWDRPVLENAVHLLTEGYAGPAALDLAETLVIVSTAEAGRRLKEALAQAVPAGVLVPWVWTAEQALLPPPLAARAATRLQTRMAWQQALQNTAVERLTALFPVLPEERGWLWQMEMARLLEELNSLLGAGGLSFADVAEQVEQDASRWRELSILGHAFNQVLATTGLEDAQILKRQTAEHPWLPEGITRVVVLAAPDLPPLFRAWLASCPVETLVGIQAPETLAGSFDSIGRPLPEHWGEESDVVQPLGEEQIHLHHDAGGQARHTLDLLRELSPGARVTVGIGDPEVGAVVSEKLKLEGVEVFEPGGVPAQQVGLWHLLQQMQALTAGSSWRAFASLLRVPEVRRAWLGGGGEGLKLLEDADELAMEHMPVTLTHALELCAQKPAEQAERLTRALEAASNQVEELQNLPLPRAARALLLSLYATREFGNAPEDQMLSTLADAWLGCCQEIEDESARFGLKPAPEEAFALSLELLSRTPLSPPRGEVDLVLQGWLELLWEPSPGLLVAGMNEEHVPGIVISHPFLPDGVRRELGLPSQASRFARDAYILRTLAEQRVSQGFLHLLCGRWSDRGDALRPSRLLLLCNQADLPRRVAHLFPKDETLTEDVQEPPRSLAWPLLPALKIPPVERISPSRIRSYLECPFRDYLSQELRMQQAEPFKRELDPGEFGTLVHHALQQLAGDPHLKVSTKVGEIAEFLIESAVTEAHRLYGEKPAPLIQLQLESLKQRLRHAAETEAAEREAGWQIYLAEWEPPEDKPLLIEGARLYCKVDRIDRNVLNGQLRVMDYKTADKVAEPLGAHVRKLSARSQIPEAEMWKCFRHSDGKAYLWKDLQLLLYAAALRLNGLRPESVGYFTLPKSVQETKVLTWQDYSDEWVDRALECAAEVVRRLREGRFWPPAARAYDRGFEELFLGNPEASVKWTGPEGAEG